MGRVWKSWGGYVDENGNEVLPAGVVDTRQGAAQGTSNGIATTNSGTGAGSANANGVTATNSNSTGVNNTANDSTTTGIAGNTGGNAATRNSGSAGVTSGAANIGVTQVKNDNTTTVGGSAGLSTSGHNGDYQGDLTLGFGASTANLSGANGGSVRAINETTGSDSTNSNDITTTTEELVEVQNDGQINNLLDLAAITGQNQASQNTGDARVTTGDANVAATLINLLNTTVINGDIWVTVADIFGDLNGNILIPELAALAQAARAQQTQIDATNDHTGSDSTNTIDVAVRDTETTTITNDAVIITEINAEAITGQNTATSNTGGSHIVTGDASVTGSNVSVANTTVEGGNWGLFIVNALNGWLGFLVGDNGQVKALSQEETIREIEANNSNTGSSSDNTIAITDEHTRTTTVDNDAAITNEINARAITGQNEASQNTGAGLVDTGNATVQATAVNIANTTVKDGSLFIAVVNVFGDWLGDLFYSGTSLAQQAAAQNPAHQIDINAGNGQTGSGSENEVNIDIDRSHETTITNEADLAFVLNAEVDTGSNRANRNTLSAAIQTGQGLLAQHSRAAANITAMAGAGGLSVDITGENGATGFDSRNTIRADINDSRMVTINNDANVSTLLGSAGSPALVNTGDNEANQNTGGARIDTGNALADIAVQNMVNRVILALTGEGVEVDVDFANRLTGALSTNTNTATVLRDTLASITNDAVIDTILNLLLNTGGNTANENTGGAITAAGGAGFAAAAGQGGDGTAITTGSICADVTVQNNANAVTISGFVGQIVNNNAVATTQLNIVGTTGNNQVNRNTTGGAASGSDPCAKVALAPTPSPTPGPGGSGGGPTGDGGSGGDSGSDGQGGSDEDTSKVAATTDEKLRQPRIAGTSILKRFPVAGGESVAQWLPGEKRFSWVSLALLSVGLLSVAYYFDHQARLRKVHAPLAHVA